MQSIDFLQNVCCFCFPFLCCFFLLLFIQSRDFLLLLPTFLALVPPCKCHDRFFSFLYTISEKQFFFSWLPLHFVIAESVVVSVSII